MQNDLIEFMVYRKRTAKAKAAMLFFFILIAACVALIPVLRSLALGVAVVLAWVTYMFVYPYSSVEYEYTYCDKIITVDRILAEKKRKMMAEYYLDRMEMIAPLDSQRWKSKEHIEFKVYDYSSHIENDNYKSYGMIYGGKQKIILDLPVEFVKILQNNAPKKVFFD